LCGVILFLNQLISRTTIDRIMQAAVIEDVIGEFVHLKRSGSSYRGLSPFANEKTPSFFVVPTKGIYKDFSSGKGGNVIDFLMEHEKMSYPETLRWLAARYQISVEEDREQTEADLAERTERENLSVVSEFALRWFREQLHDSPEGQAVGLSYFQERGFRDDIIEKFQLGYCPDGWDYMTRAALDAGYNLEYLVKAGLSREREGSSPYDFFRGRVIFPIHNISGKVIAFAGRTLKVAKDTAKYFNSPESELYHKSSILFGMHLARNAMVKHDVCYLVEGYTDVISLHQAGIENVVASSGTSLTEGQIRLIKRYTRKITILFDGDAAGIKASFRGIDMILKEGLHVRVVLFPDGDDPDSFAQKHPGEEIQDFIANESKDFIQFKTALLLDDAGNDPIRRAELIRGIMESISLIPDGIQRSVYVQETSRLLDIQEAVLTAELNKVIRAQFKKTTREDLPVLDEVPTDIIPDSIPEPEFTLYHQEKEFTRLLLNYGEEKLSLMVMEDEQEKVIETTVAHYLLQNLEADEIEPETPSYARIVSEYKALILDTIELQPAARITRIADPEVSQSISDLVTSRHSLSPNWAGKHQIFPETEEMNLRKTANDCLFWFKIRKVMHMIRAIDAELSKEGLTAEEADDLLKEKMALNQAKVELAHPRGTALL